MKVYIVLVYFKDRLDGVYGCYKTEKTALEAMEKAEESGLRATIQILIPR